MTDELVEQQGAGAIEVEDPRDQYRRRDGSVRRADDPPLVGHEPEGVDRHRHALPARARRSRRLRPAAAVRRRGRWHPALPTVTIVQSSPSAAAFDCRAPTTSESRESTTAGGAELHRELAPLLRRIQREDLARAADACSLDRVHADAAGSDDRAAAAGRHVDGGDRGAHARDHGAADERRDGGGHVRR